MGNNLTPNDMMNFMMQMVMVKFILNDVPHTAGLTSAKVFYHVTPEENVASIAEAGLLAPVYLLTNMERAFRWQKEVEEYEPASILIVILPADWKVEGDPLHPKGMSVVSRKDIPSRYVKVFT